VRVRLGNTWYFPTSAGQWESLAVRQIRWEHTFYGDGRRVTDVVVNNAGGRDVSAVRIAAPGPVAWSSGRSATVMDVRPFPGSVGRWSFLMAPPSKRKALYGLNYRQPAGFEIRMGSKEAADGDVDADGFDESQGCYHLRAKDGHCRFLLRPGGDGLADAAIRVSGSWRGPVAANSEGLPLRELGVVPGRAVVLRVPGVLTRPTWVEVTGPADAVPR